MTMKNPDKPIIYDRIESPIGSIVLAGDGEALSFVGLPESRHPVNIPPEWTRSRPAFAKAKRQFDAYFAGELINFDRLAWPMARIPCRSSCRAIA